MGPYATLAWLFGAMIVWMAVFACLLLEVASIAQGRVETTPIGSGSDEGGPRSREYGFGSAHID